MMKRRKKENRFHINKKIAIVFILAAAAAALIFSGANLSPKKQEEKNGGVIRPRLSFTYEGYEINTLPAYQEEMSIPLMRDVITPVKGGILPLNIADSGTISDIVYELYSLDGKECLFKGRADSGATVLNLAPDLIKEERVLVITLYTESPEQVSESYRFYTRVMALDQNPPLPAMAFIERFHQGAIERKEEGLIANAIEPDGSGDRGHLQYVNIHSGYHEVTWGDMKPEKQGQVVWEIKEMNDISVSVRLSYRVLCHRGEDEEGTYDVEEFYRVRHIKEGDVTYLLDYERHISQRMEAPEVSETGIELGMAGDDVVFSCFGENREIAFAVGREVWRFGGEKKELVKVFQGEDFGNIEKIKIISRSEEGNLAFAVYGHKDVGEMKNRFGVYIYEYTARDNVTKEVMAVISRTSPEIFVMETGKLMHYRAGDRLLYVLFQGKIHELSADTGEDKVIAEDMEETEYIVSPTGNCMVFPLADGESGLSGLQILNFETGENSVIEAEPGEGMKPLGFINEDMIYGVYREEDRNQMPSGEEQILMYKVDIADENQTVKKTYSQDGVFVVKVRVEENVITLERVKNEGEAYVPMDNDFITSNEKEDQRTPVLENVLTEKGRAVKVIAMGEPVGRPERKEALPPEEKKTVTAVDVGERKGDSYYVYGHGELKGIFDNPGEAIVTADRFNGVVVAENQHYVWERGNRNLVFSLEGKEEEVRKILENLKGSLSPEEAVEKALGKKAADFSACTAEELCYVINCNIPVAARMGTGEGIVLVGYDEETLTYRIEEGEEKTCSYREMDQWIKDAGISIAACIENILTR